MFRNFFDLWAELGPLNCLFWAINRCFRRPGGGGPIVRYYFVAQPVPEKALLPGHRGRSIDVRMVRPDDPALSSLPLSDDVLKFRFAQKAICFGAFRGDTIIGCLWFCLHRYEEDEVRCTYLLCPEQKTAWDFDVYVVPEARGGFAFMRLWDETNAYLRSHGISWSLSRISAFNPGSLGAHGKLGARRISSALFFKAGKLQLMFSGVRPFCHFSGSADRSPTLVLSTPDARKSG